MGFYCADPKCKIKGHACRHISITRCVPWLQLVMYDIGSLGEETFDMWKRNYWADGGTELWNYM